MERRDLLDSWFNGGMTMGMLVWLEALGSYLAMMIISPTVASSRFLCSGYQGTKPACLCVFTTIVSASSALMWVGGIDLVLRPSVWLRAQTRDFFGSITRL
jgi:hypothetical protein